MRLILPASTALEHHPPSCHTKVLTYIGGIPVYSKAGLSHVAFQARVAPVTLSPILARLASFLSAAQLHTLQRLSQLQRSANQYTLALVFLY